MTLYVFPDENLRPFNQDAVAKDVLVYGNSIHFIAGYVRRMAAEKYCTEEEMVAQVEKDLKVMLDQLGPTQ